jgi:hypothetical protein
VRMHSESKGGLHWSWGSGDEGLAREFIKEAADVDAEGIRDSLGIFLLVICLFGWLASCCLEK